ncbi:hypothetical protein [Bacillus sp. 3255]|uniref:hypothetical protein n=1 Tax=Bacillus sp. 3255 TaxID=2817904 RepID=UPI00285EC096|nr:hypothetical protein [Bacillus sp. 3255]MDR6879933.1 hypothetical protein [Bacillus sp. 3255]
MLHPFMGIENWDRVGLSVEESARRLQRLAYVDRSCMRLEAGHLAARPEYEVKGALARFTWQDAECYNQLRNRCKQLRMGVRAFEKCPDDALEQLMAKVLESHNTLNLLVALFEVVKPAQIEAIEAYLAEAQPLVDEPTIHLLQHQLIDRRGQMTWGRQAIAHFMESAAAEDQASAARWKHYIEALLQAAGGIDGVSDREPVEERAIVATEPFQLPYASTRDARFLTSVIKMKGVTFEDNDNGRFLQMMLSRYFEMSAAEGVALVHFSTEGKPWSFYYDTARHLWDEVRHCWFGEAALLSKGYDVHAIPNWTGWYDMASQLFNRDEAYTHLTIAIEKAAMKYPPGKREEWEFCRDIAQDPLMTTFQDFDWADEVVHAGFGQRWIIEELFHGDNVKALEAAEETMAKRAEFMKAQEDADPVQLPERFAGNY